MRRRDRRNELGVSVKIDYSRSQVRSGVRVWWGYGPEVMNKFVITSTFHSYNSESVKKIEYYFKSNTQQILEKAGPG